MIPKKDYEKIENILKEIGINEKFDQWIKKINNLSKALKTDLKTVDLFYATQKLKTPTYEEFQKAILDYKKVKIQEQKQIQDLQLEKEINDQAEKERLEAIEKALFVQNMGSEKEEIEQEFKNLFPKFYQYFGKTRRLIQHHIFDFMTDKENYIKKVIEDLDHIDRENVLKVLGR